MKVTGFLELLIIITMLCAGLPVCMMCMTTAAKVDMTYMDDKTAVYNNSDGHELVASWSWNIYDSSDVLLSTVIFDENCPENSYLRVPMADGTYSRIFDLADPIYYNHRWDLKMKDSYGNPDNACYLFCQGGIGWNAEYYLEREAVDGVRGGFVWRWVPY